MTTKWPPTNFEVVGQPTRKRPISGDVFFCKAKTGRIVVGRVIHNQAQFFGGSGEEFLLYFYKFKPKTVENVCPPFEPVLLIPPVVSDYGGWRRGTFKTICNAPVLKSERLKKHYFMQNSADDCSRPTDPGAEFCDEFQRKVRRPKAGEYWTYSGLANFAVIDYELSRALRMRPAPDS